MPAKTGSELLESRIGIDDDDGDLMANHQRFNKYNPDPRPGRSGLQESQIGVERGRGAIPYQNGWRR